MTGVEEAALVAAVAPEVVGATAGTAAATGAAAGAGALGAGMGGGTAALFGAAPGMAASMMAPEAAAGLGAGMGGGTAALFGPATAGVSPFAAEMATVTPASAGMNVPWSKLATQAGKGLLQPQQPQGMGGAQRPPSSAQAESAAQIMQRLQRGMGPRSNFAGLLGQALGRY